MTGQINVLLAQCCDAILLNQAYVFSRDNKLYSFSSKDELGEIAHVMNCGRDVRYLL